MGAAIHEFSCRDCGKKFFRRYRWDDYIPVIIFCTECQKVRDEYYAKTTLLEGHYMVSLNHNDIAEYMKKYPAPTGLKWEESNYEALEGRPGFKWEETHYVCRLIKEA